MSLGMLVRADHRGLATMTGIMARCLQPDRVLLVDMGTHSPTACHPDDYPDRWGTVTYDELLGGGYDWEPFLDDLTCVYTAEVPYDFRLFTTAAARGVKTVLHVMPELDPYVRQPGLPRPDVVALPTTWMADRYPDAPILPVPAEPFTPRPGTLVVHPGALAMKDRNGTRTVIDASLLTERHLVVRCQAPPDRPWHHARIEVDDVADGRELFDYAALVVVPRRYGGLSLVIQEAMAAGLPVLFGAHDVYRWEFDSVWLASERDRDLQAKGGSIPTYSCDPASTAATIDMVMADDELRGLMAAASRDWAVTHSWGAVRPAWDAVLGTTIAA